MDVGTQIRHPWAGAETERVHPQMGALFNFVYYSALHLGLECAHPSTHGWAESHQKGRSGILSFSSGSPQWHQGSFTGIPASQLFGETSWRFFTISEMHCTGLVAVLRSVPIPNLELGWLAAGWPCGHRTCQWCPGMSWGNAVSSFMAFLPSLHILISWLLSIVLVVIKLRNQKSWPIWISSSSDLTLSFFTVIPFVFKLIF